MRWPQIRLDELYEIARGGSPRPIKNFLTDDPNGINWIKIGDATASGKYIYETKEKIIPEGIQRSRFVKEGDFILSNSMSFGRPYIMGTSGCIHDGWLVLSPKDDRVEQDFLYHILSSPFVFQQFNSLAAGSTVRNLNIDLVSGVKIPLLPIPEQKRIVAILDEAFADIDRARELTKRNLKNARELFDSYLQQVFSQRGEGWIASNLKSLSSKVGSGATPRGGKSSYKDEGISLIRSMNVHDRTFVKKDLAFIDDEQAEKLSNVVIEKNDVLLNITGASVARCCIPPEDVLPARVNQHVSIIRLDQEKLLPKFLNYALTSKIYKDQLLGIGEAGSTRQAITKNQLESFTINFPASIEQQLNYISQLELLEEQTQELERIYNKKLVDLEELKKSLLQKAFSGELTKDETLTSDNIVPFPHKVANISPTDLHAGVLALAYQAHEANGNVQHFGHVKAEKIAHMAEALVGIDLDRKPIQDAAGPNDYPHFKKKVEPRAKKAGFFTFAGSEQSGYQLVKGRQFDAIASRTEKALEASGYLPEVQRLIDLMLPMDMAKAEIFATVYAAWNNLLLDKSEITDEAIVLAARENWHESKLKIPRERFFKAIDWMKENNCVPKGIGKYVHANGALK